MQNFKKGFFSTVATLVIALVLIGLGVFVYTQNKTDFTLDESRSVTTKSEPSNHEINLSEQGLKKAPDYIFNQTDTVELNLSNNSIGGALQSQIGKLQNLKVLNLSNNKFTGVPAEIGHLKNLETLNLSNNWLTGLPNELGTLSKLKLLDISGNNYSEGDLAGIKAHLPVSTVIKTN